MPDDLTWAQRLAAARAAGFDGVEMSIDETDSRLARLDWTRQQRRELSAITRDSDVSIRSVCLSGHRKFPLGSSVPEIERRSLQLMEKAVHLADDIGVRIIQLAGYDVYYHESSTPETAERFLRNLRKSAEIAASYGIILAIETMENDFLNTVEKGMYYVNNVFSPYLQMYPDIGNLYNAVSDIQADLRKGAGHIVAAHLKETVPSVFRNLHFGEGRVDFAKAARILKDTGVNYFTAEFWYDGGADWQNKLSYAHDFLYKYLK